VRKAEDDFQTAEILAAAGKPLYDQIAFHCQQTAEKYVKALLEELGLSVPKTHDLEDLMAPLPPPYAELRRYRRGMRFLTGFAVDPRYPLLHITRRQSASARRWAREVREACRLLLGLERPSRRRKRT
jgi:HEPN domain-containing protein